MIRRWVGIGVALLLVVAAAGTWRYLQAKQPDFAGMVLTEPRPIADFTLRDADGRPFRLSDQRGRVVLIFFGYTHCPDVCPATLGLYRDLAARLGDRVDDVRLVFITVDPERDTPERLRQYLPRYGPHVLGLTGSQQELEPVWARFGVKREKVTLPDSDLGYAVAHPSQIFVIDQQGRLRLLYPFGFTAKQIERDVRLLLASGGR